MAGKRRSGAARFGQNGPAKRKGRRRQPVIKELRCMIGRANVDQGTRPPDAFHPLHRNRYDGCEARWAQGRSTPRDGTCAGRPCPRCRLGRTGDCQNGIRNRGSGKLASGSGHDLGRARKSVGVSRIRRQAEHDVGCGPLRRSERNITTVDLAGTQGNVTWAASARRSRASLCRRTDQRSQ